MIYDYAQEKVFTKQLDIEDPGNTCLKAIDITKSEYYMLIKTTMGKTSVLKFGPVVPDIPMLLEGFETTYKKFNYKENTINKEIKLFINDPKKEIDEVVETLSSEAFEAYPNIEEIFNDL